MWSWGRSETQPAARALAAFAVLHEPLKLSGANTTTRCEVTSEEALGEEPRLQINARTCDTPATATAPEPKAAHQARGRALRGAKSPNPSG